MGNLTEFEIAKAYEGKPFIAAKLRKITIGSGNTSAAVFSRRLTKSQGALIGITDEIYNKWWDDDIYWGVIISLDDSFSTIERCYINKTRLTYNDNGKGHHIKLSSTQEEITIFQTIMEFITQ